MKASRPKPPGQEIPPLKHSFAKGCHYENMKGPYEVLSIGGNTMRIRWENGEESETDVDLQDRILSRFEREVRAAKIRPTIRQEELEVNLVPRFRGLVPADFSQDVTATTWRSRNSGLGNAVTQGLEVGNLGFGFWVPFRKPMILWADVSRGAGSAAQLQSGFFCRLDQTRAHFGIFVRRPHDGDGNGDWHRFLEWLKLPEHEAGLWTLAAEKGLRVFPCEETPSFLQASSAHWVWTEEDHRTNVPNLGEFLAARPAAPGTVLHCATSVEKDRAVRRAVKFGDDLAQIFGSLMPLYRACLGLAEETKPRRAARKRVAS